MTNSALRTEIAKLFPYVSANIADRSYAVLTQESFLKTSKYVKWILKVFGIFPDKMVNTLQTAMTTTQLITASIGTVIAFII